VVIKEKIMSILASYIHNIKPSITLSLANKARELKSQGVELYDLSIGEPDFDTFNNIKDAAIKAINQGKTKYTDVRGLLQLREAICKNYEARCKFSTNNVIVSAGAKQSIYNALMVTLNEGDEVILPAPYWVSYPDMVKIARGIPVAVECDEKDNFKLTPEKLEKAITKKTKWLLLNSPNNPSGIKYFKKELEAIVSVLKRHPNVYVLSDDIYEDLCYDGSVLSFVDVAHEIMDRLLVVNGVSKSYAMTGWRIGYAIGPSEIISAMSILQSQSTSNPCSVSQYAAIEALNGPQEYMRQGVEQFKKKRDLTYDLLTEDGSLTCCKPEGAFYLFPKCSEFFGKRTENGSIINNDQDFCSYLLDQSVVVVPGSAFGMAGYFRISYAASEETLKSAVNKIKDSIRKLV